MNKPFHQYQFICLVCENDFYSLKPNAKTCCGACRTRLWRFRHLYKDKLNQLTGQDTNPFNIKEDLFSKVPQVNLKNSENNFDGNFKEAGILKDQSIPIQEMVTTSNLDESTPIPKKEVIVPYPIDPFIPFQVLQTNFGSHVRLYGFDVSLSDVFSDSEKQYQLAKHILKHKYGLAAFHNEVEVGIKQAALQILLNNRKRIFKQLRYVGEGVNVYQTTLNLLSGSIDTVSFLSHHQL